MTPRFQNRQRTNACCELILAWWLVHVLDLFLFSFLFRASCYSCTALLFFLLIEMHSFMRCILSLFSCISHTALSIPDLFFYKTPRWPIRSLSSLVLDSLNAYCISLFITMYYTYIWGNAAILIRRILVASSYQPLFGSCLHGIRCRGTKESFLAAFLSVDKVSHFDTERDDIIVKSFQIRKITARMLIINRFRYVWTEA